MRKHKRSVENPGKSDTGPRVGFDAPRFAAEVVGLTREPTPGNPFREPVAALEALAEVEAGDPYHARELLDWIAGRLEAGDPLPAPALRYLAPALRAILAGEDPGAALGLARRPGPRADGYRKARDELAAQLRDLDRVEAVRLALPDLDPPPTREEGFKAPPAQIIAGALDELALELGINGRTLRRALSDWGPRWVLHPPRGATAADLERMRAEWADSPDIE